MAETKLTQAQIKAIQQHAVVGWWTEEEARGDEPPSNAIAERAYADVKALLAEIVRQRTVIQGYAKGAYEQSATIGDQSHTIVKQHTQIERLAAEVRALRPIVEHVADYPLEGSFCGDDGWYSCFMGCGARYFTGEGIPEHELGCMYLGARAATGREAPE